MDVDITEGTTRATVRARGCLSLRTAADLRDALLKAAAEQPRGVVCDLRDLTAGAASLTVLHVVADQLAVWPGAPLAVVAVDPYLVAQLRRVGLHHRMPVVGDPEVAAAALRHAPGHLAAATTVAPAPGAPAAARGFVTRTLTRWRVHQPLEAARWVASELVANAVVHAGTEATLRLALTRDRLRLSVADHGAGGFGTAPRAGPGPGSEPCWGLTVVGDLSRSWGVLPRLGNGSVVWAVLDAPGAVPRVVPRQAAERV